MLEVKGQQTALASTPLERHLTLEIHCENSVVIGKGQVYPQHVPEFPLS